MTDRFEVAVIGAGAAGLAAAKELAAQGIRFVLLEASHRIGGRAHTEYPPDGAPFDLGCHWMHSASINPCLLYTSPSPRDYAASRMPSSA